MRKIGKCFKFESDQYQMWSNDYICAFVWHFHIAVFFSVSVHKERFWLLMSCRIYAEYVIGASSDTFFGFIP